jgi:hypothetical protein
MTPEAEERFQRIEALLMQTTELALRGQQRQDQAQQRHEDWAKDFDARLNATQHQIDANAQAIADFRRDYEASIEDLMQLSVQTLNMASENITYIRGLQVENRRILRELRDRRQGNQ